MFRNPFDGARAKIERAHRHFKELVAAQAELGKPQQLDIEIEAQPNGDTKVFGTAYRLPTLEHGAIVADILGNFRSALDIATHQACLARGAQDQEKLARTYFPVGGNERDWEGNIKNRCAAADKEVIEILRAFKPWKDGGNALIYALSKIAAKDKHVDLVAVAQRPSSLEIDGVKTSNPEGKLSGFQGLIPTWHSPRAELFTILAPAQVEVTGPCILRAKFGFGEVYALTGKPVVPTLNEMGAMCEKIIDALEAVAKLP